MQGCKNFWEKTKLAHGSIFLIKMYLCAAFVFGGDVPAVAAKENAPATKLRFVLWQMLVALSKLLVP